MAAILTRAARILFAKHLKEGTLHIAFCTGSSSWDSLTPTPYPVYTVNQTTVTAEFVRKIVLNKQFVTPDAEGEVIVESGRFAFTSTPTEHLYCKATLEPSEYSTSIIREFGLFYGATVQTGLPSGQLLFTPGQVTSVGTLCMVKRIAKRQRTATTRQLCEFVWTV